MRTAFKYVSLAAVAVAAVLFFLWPVSREKIASDKLTVVATLFPTFDFARQVGGDYADVTLLMPPGVDAHSYEPTASDIMKINSSDIFIFTGQYMEPWAEQMISASDIVSGRVVDASSGISLDQTTDGGDGDPGETYDPHIWTDPVQAETMVATIADTFCAADPAHADGYRANAAVYTQKLAALDAEFQNIVTNGKRTEMIFGGRFALHYFVKRYGLTAESAYAGCAEDSEPSPKVVADLIDEARAKKIPVIYYGELESPSMAETIASEAAAVTLEFDSCHNITKAEFDAGATYLSVMERNAVNLQKGLD